MPLWIVAMSWFGGQVTIAQVTERLPILGRHRGGSKSKIRSVVMGGLEAGRS
jgi:hypothetical protein